MAGIGFELKRLFTKGGIVGTIRGVVYASMTTIGPLVMIVVTLFAMYIFLDYSSVGFVSRELLASTILYVFIFSLLTTSPVNSVLSRYIADKLFDEKEDDILASYYVGLFVNTIIAVVLGIPFALIEYFVGHIDPLYIFASYCMYIALMFVFFNMTYISALKEYKKITYSFIIGLLVALVTSIILVRIVGTGLDSAIVYSFAVGFTIIAFLLFAQVKSFFKVNSGNYKETFEYFKRHRVLFFINLFYTLSLYAHNFVFWGSSLQVVVRDCFVSAPVYDMATCIAMFINISTMVIFIVQVETNFHERYTRYCQAVIGGTSHDIALTKHDMLKTIKDKMNFIFQLQLLINVILFLCAILFLPRIGIGGLILDILPSLTVAYFALFMMYSLIIFMYYFEDTRGALLTVLICLILTTAGSVFCMFLTPPFYGAGLFVGALIAFAFAYMRLKKVEENLEIHVFCKGTVIPKEVVK